MCFYCRDENKDDFYLDTLISKKHCVTIENDACNINRTYDIIYNNKFYHTSCLKKC